MVGVIMRMRELLREIEALTNERKKVYRRIEDARERATGVSPAYSLAKVEGGMAGSRVESGALNAALGEDAIAEIDAELAQLRKKVEPYIALLDKREQRAIVHKRLIEGMSCEEIAREEHYSVSGVYKALRKAKRRIIFLASKSVHISPLASTGNEML